MTDGRFLNNYFEICEAIRVKCETLMQDSWAYKTPNNCRNRSKGLPLGATLYEKVEIVAIFEAAFPPRAPIGM